MVNHELFNDFNKFVVALEWMSLLKWILTPLTRILPYIYANDDRGCTVSNSGNQCQSYMAPLAVGL